MLACRIFEPNSIWKYPTNGRVQYFFIQLIRKKFKFLEAMDLKQAVVYLSLISKRNCAQLLCIFHESRIWVSIYPVKR